MTTTTREVPYSREAEEQVVGAVLINQDVFAELYFLKPADFHIHRNQWVWSAFTELHKQRTVIDLLTVSDYLERHGLLDEIGGAAHLTALVNQAGTSLAAVEHGRIIEAYSIRRKFITAAESIAKNAYDLKLDVKSVVDQSLASVYSASDRQAEKSATIGEALSAAYDQSANAAAENGVIGIPTGFIDLDAYLTGSGLRNSKVYYIGGRPGLGKSAFLLDLAISAAFDHHKRVRIFSQEMDYIEIAIRVAAKRLNIDTKKIEEGDLTGSEWEQYLALVDAVQDYEKYPITIDETAPLTPLSMLSICQNEWLRNNLDLVIVDYEQLLKGEGATLREQTTDVSRNTKRLARQLHIPVVGAVQLSRKTEDNKRPVLSDMQETGAFEQDADVVILLSNDKKKPNVVRADLAKQRGGKTGVVDLIFRKEIVKFESAYKPAVMAQQPSLIGD